MSAHTCLSVETRPVPAVPAAPARDSDRRSCRRRLAALLDRPCRAGGSRTASWTFAPVVSSVPEARHRAGATVRRWGLTGEGATAELLVTEVITNALDQSREPIRLTLTWADGLLRGEVEDHGSKQALPEQTRLPDPVEESGRGLFLLDVLACCWGVEYTATGKVVWFELPCGLPARPGAR
ncbi:ATP-binding protein [Nonomuraea zeae]|uniref:ATP-binding protein n=1 Tax=Nonomuraea zeae TaxID=1642303 RepID=A0A5S4G5R8_9ACTN|nr:ATP-binding protein [Nonomuraea zeae]TMR28357.1 ATP-binding protein [Nonomuraea zeae]